MMLNYPKFIRGQAEAGTYLTIPSGLETFIGYFF